MKKIVVFLGIAIFMTMAGTSVAQDAEAAEEAATYKGSKKCKMCHKDQYNIWLESPHATAFDKLEEADQAKEDCVACHVMGKVDGSVEHAEPGVGCESCHNPGSKYAAKGVMSKKTFKADPEGSKENWYTLGLVKPTEENCVACHNEKSPNFEGFDFDKYMAKIRHWDLDELEAAETPATEETVK